MAIRTADLFSIATSGVRAQNQLLQTTSHNIANVNTEGFVRERTTFVDQLSGGVGRGYTERVINTFAQNQLRRDTTKFAEAEAFYQRVFLMDNILASEANSISGSLSRYFAALQTAIDEPSNVSGRDLLLGEANSLLTRMSSLSDYLSTSESELNLELDSVTREANDLIKTIADLNTQIRETRFSNVYEEPGALKNQRDNAILQLSELMSIETRNLDDGSTLVNLTSGQSLVLESGRFNVLTLSGDPDITRKTLRLSVQGNPTTIDLPDINLGGKMGALFEFRDEVLGPSQRQLGQLALAFADAMNEQNRLGMDLDGQLGGNLFTLPTTAALNYADNSSSTLRMNGRVTEGDAEMLSSVDYRVTITAVTAGAPNTVDVTVALLNPDGTPALDANGAAITQNYPGLTAATGTFEPILDGLELEFPDGAGYAVGDSFLLQPTRRSAEQITAAIVRGEDFAFASPIRAQGNINNLGSASVLSTAVTNTTVDNTFANNEASAFDGAGGIHGVGASPAAGLGAPAQIIFTGADDYEVRDSAGNLITTVTNAPNLNNLIGQASATAGWPAAFAALSDYPGYDVSLKGIPKAGDVFTLSYNTAGTDDNRNGLAIAALQDANTIRRDVSAPFSAQNGTSFHGAYAELVTSVGEKSATADIEVKATTAMKQQSNDWYESISGVSLDEEAANLVRFQQAYSASARILSAAQNLFDTILGVVR